MDMLPWLLILLLFAFIVYSEHKNRKERALHLNFIDKLQNKLMSRDFNEYAAQTRTGTKKNVTNPLMDNIVKNYTERENELRSDPDE